MSQNRTDEKDQGRRGGSTPGGASESAQPESKQEGPGSLRRLPGSQPAELPDLDPETAAGVNPRPASPPNPALAYDDDAAGKPEDAKK